MKEEMKMQLIKDIVIAVVAGVVGAIVLGHMSGEGFNFMVGILFGVFLAGIPFGWKWMSNIFTAVSFQAVFIKFFLSLVLGWIALPIIIIKDIIAYVTAE